MKKLNKVDLYNLSCLKLAQIGVWTSQRCLDSMKWGKRTRTRSQDRYLKSMVETLARIDREQPGLLESLFKSQTDSIIAKEKENGN